MSENRREEIFFDSHCIYAIKYQSVTKTDERMTTPVNYWPVGISLK